MINKEDFAELQERFDARYKKIEDCNTEMDAVKQEHTSMYVAIGKIEETQRNHTWLLRSILGAVISAIVGAVFLLITKGG